MSSFLNEKFSSLSEYVPGEQPQDKKYIKLNTNESPFPPSNSVLNAINKTEIEDLRLYSDPCCKLLRTKIAKLYNVDFENVYCSNGSDDILNFAFMAFSQNGVVFSDISYGFYSVFADLYNIDTEIIPLENDFSIDYKKYLNKNKMIVIANPNAPTGLSLKSEEIEEIVKTNKNNVVLIDEAYIDFGGESCYNLIKKYNNLLVVGTFSKSRSMAGARLGFAFANSNIIKDLEKIKFSTNPYDINRLTQKCGAAAIDDNDYYINNCKKIIENREYTVKNLEALGFTVLNSKANFVFAKSKKIGGLELYLKLKDRGILVRHFEKERIKDFNRITIGSIEEMTKLINEIKNILEEY